MEINKMKKTIVLTLCAAGLFAVSSCDDFLETGSPSVVDADFVFSNIATARAAMDGAYEAWRDCASTNVFGDGLYYATEIPGSDIERHPEAFTNQPGRHWPECLYQNGTYASQYGLLSYQTEDGAYSALYEVIGKSNAIINAMQTSEEFESFMSAGSPSDLSQLYGEAMALRATAYRELIKYFGDVPYVSKSGEGASGLCPRDSIYDVCINDLKTVEPLMYRTGDNSTMAKNILSRNYVDGLIGRMCMDAGGYQTRRTDLGSDFYKDGNGNQISLEQKGTANNDCVYARRTDWESLYTTARSYLLDCINNPGAGTTFHATAPRSASSNGQVYDNPYQNFFQQLNDQHYADESVYEYAQTQGTGNDSRPYSFGRVSSGGSANAYPCKDYGQGRINPAYYYGVFDPNDKRRDVSVCITGSDGAGYEKLIPFTPNSKAEGGGLTLNKWDECRMSSPYVAKQRTSGINGPYMRIAEIYLLYAEASAALGDEVTAKQYLTTIRERSFPSGKANTDEFISSCGSLLRAVIEERGFEFAGEGDRRWTLVRSGFLPEAIQRIKEMTKDMMDGLQTKGYYTFENGNVISNYVWTKMVDAGTQYGYRLTTQCPEGQEDDPVLYPGWRGQNDDWEGFGLDYGTSTPATNVAIKGLFKYIDPDGAEAKALEAEGYERVDWGVELANNYDEYYTYLFYDYDYTKAPIYLWPFTPNVMSTGGFTNGYGFKQE